MNKKNNLVEIAEILVKLKEERMLKEIPENYPKGSVGIIIDGDKFVVDNSAKSEIISSKMDQNSFKDDSLKYNPNFYLSTFDSGEPEIIDEFHNKGRLINEAYTEISFLPKDIISQAKLDKKMGREALKIIMPDENQISLMDFDYYDIEQPVYSHSADGGIQTEYDEIFRCRCTLTDITGNEMVENFLIVAHKVSQKANSEYSYEVKTDSENIKKLVENIEKKAEDKDGDLRFQFPPMTNDEYERISTRVEAGIIKYFKDNRDKNYRITSVDIKAIYCLRLNKIPITVLLKKDDATIAKIDTYYSMVWSDLNVYTCPHCKSTSNQLIDNVPMKIHVCHDFSTVDEGVTGGYKPIGCNRCMEFCSRCGAWHFKMSEYPNVESKFRVLSSRQFLRHLIKKKVNSDDYCQCKENLYWIYDEMTPIINNNQTYFNYSIDKFLSGACKLVFVNSLTGEQVASYKDFVLFLHNYLEFSLDGAQKLLDKYNENMPEKMDYEAVKEHVHNFVSMYKNYNKEELIDSPFGRYQLENIISRAITTFKEGLEKAFSYKDQVIKMTSSDRMKICDSCHGKYVYSDGNAYDYPQYHNGINECISCSDAKLKNYRNWVRLADNVNFYKSPKMKVTRTIQSLHGEVNYDEWLKSTLNKQIHNKIFKK